MSGQHGTTWQAIGAEGRVAKVGGRRASGAALTGVPELVAVKLGVVDKDALAEVDPDAVCAAERWESRARKLELRPAELGQQIAAANRGLFAFSPKHECPHMEHGSNTSWWHAGSRYRVRRAPAGHPARRKEC